MDFGGEYYLRHCRDFNTCRRVVFGWSLESYGEITLGARARNDEIKFISLCKNFLRNFEVEAIDHY